MRVSIPVSRSTSTIQGLLLKSKEYRK